VRAVREAIAAGRHLSTLAFSDDGQQFSPTSDTTGWTQSLNLRTGIVTTSARWTAPNGHVTDLVYRVFTDRANPYVGLVRLQLIPHWSGIATVTDEIDGTPATLTTQVGKGWNGAVRRDWVSIRTEGTGISATLASQLRPTSTTPIPARPGPPPAGRWCPRAPARRRR